MDLNIQQFGEKLKESPLYRGTVLQNESMAAHTTMKVGGNADLFLCPEDALSCAWALSECKKNNIKTYILGAGSNVIAADEGFRGAIISTQNFKSIESLSIQYDAENKAFTEISCGSGVLIDEIVDFCEKKGLKTLYTFAGLPASCGGAVYMNARCYSVDMAEFVKSVEYIDLDRLYQICSELETIEDDYAEDKKSEILNKNKIILESSIKIYQNNNIEGEWAYKLSPFTGKNVLITRVILKAEVLGPETYAEGKNVSAELQSELHTENQKYVQDRTEKGHFRKPSAGSVFKNNRAFNVPSGKLVDEVGLKGTVYGGAEISSWHGNFIVNNGNASAEDIKELVKLAQTKVKERFGFDLECEIIFI